MPLKISLSSSMDQKATILECQSLAPCGAPSPPLPAHLIRGSGRRQSAGGPRRATLPGQRLHPGAAEHRRSLRVETFSRKGLTGFPFKESTLFSSCPGKLILQWLPFATSFAKGRPKKVEQERRSFVTWPVGKDGFGWHDSLSPTH